MAKSYFGTQRLVTSTAATTQYWSFPGGGQVPSTTEANNQTIFRTAGTTSKFRFLLFANTVNESYTTITRKNGGDGNMSVSVPASTTGMFSDEINTDTIALGDLYCIQTSPSGTSTGTFSGLWYTALFESTGTTNTITKLASTGSSLIGTGGNGARLSIVGDSTLSTSINIMFEIQRTGIFKNMGIYVSASIGGGPITLIIDLISSDLVIDVPDSTTGWFENLTDVARVHAYNRLFYRVIRTTGAGTNFTFRAVTVEYESLDNSSICIGNWSHLITASTSRFNCVPLGSMTNTNATSVASWNQPVLFDAIASNFAAELYTNQKTDKVYWEFVHHTEDGSTTTFLGDHIVTTIQPNDFTTHYGSDDPTIYVARTDDTFDSQENRTLNVGTEYEKYLMFRFEANSLEASNFVQTRFVIVYLTEIISSPSVAHNRQFVGMARSADHQWSTWTGDADAQSESINSRLMSRNSVIQICDEIDPSGSSIVKARANYREQDSDGFTIIWSTIDTSNAYEIIYVAFGD